MKRYKHSLSHYHLTSFDMGQLVPVACLEVLPGDSFQQSTSALVRLTPQLKPVMHPVNIQIHHFFVPNRLLWSGWEDFITGESETAPPTISGAAHSEGTLSDYLGVYNDASNDFSALPVRAYNKIFNEFYRDQDLVTEVSEDSNVVQNAAWSKDYFTTARPWAQKGDAVTLPVGSEAEVKAYNDGTTMKVRSTFGTIQANVDPLGSDADGDLEKAATGGDVIIDPNGALYADLSSANAIDINDFREAFALQRYQEARSRYGSNYVDYLRYLGIRPSDARLQRPEYLGGGRQSISFSEVLSTNDAGTLGELGGHGIGAVRSNRYRRYFEEHGYVITMMVVRPKPIYVNGLPRKFSRTTKEDYYQRELETIGQQEVLNKEVYAAHGTPNGTFGYQNRYREYTEEPSRVSSEFRNSTSYDWHLGRIFSSDPALNATFVECDPTKRVFAEQTQDALQVMVQNNVQARRMVSKRAIGSVF
jgi:hypothetical protein